VHLCQICKKYSLVLASDEINYTEKMLIGEYLNPILIFSIH
jgi:hypothetical protein